MRLFLLWLFLTLSNLVFPQAILTGSIFESDSSYVVLPNAKLHFLKNDTTIYSAITGTYYIALKKYMDDTLEVTHFALGTIKLPVTVVDSATVSMSIGGHTKLDYGPSSWWLEKPSLKRDSALLLKSKFSRIIIYALFDKTADSSMRWIKAGTWVLHKNKERIYASTWAFSPPQEYYDELHSRSFQKDKIIDEYLCKHGSINIVHYLNENGIIYLSRREIPKKSQSSEESCSVKSYFDEIRYVYKDGLLVKANIYVAGTLEATYLYKYR